MLRPHLTNEHKRTRHSRTNNDPSLVVFSRENACSWALYARVMWMGIKTFSILLVLSFNSGGCQIVKIEESSYLVLSLISEVENLYILWNSSYPSLIIIK